MARRKGGGDKLFKRRKEERTKSSFNRNKATLEKLEKLLISCEGTKTEPMYFRSYFNELVKSHKISALSFIIAKHKHTNPSGVLEDLLSYNENTETYKNFKHKWIVIDRDEERTNGGGHTLQDYNNAINRANHLGIEVAFSNPSFEIWFLLHYQYRNTAINRDLLIQELKKTICYEKNDPNMFETLLSNQSTAIRFAEKLDADCNLDKGNCNPSTSVYKLVKILNEYMAD